MNKFAQLVYHELLKKYSVSIQSLSTFIIEEIDETIKDYRGDIDQFYIYSLQGIQQWIYKDYHNVLDLDLRNHMASSLFKKEVLQHYDDFIIKLSKAIAKDLGGK